MTQTGSAFLVSKWYKTTHLYNVKQFIHCLHKNLPNEYNKETVHIYLVFVQFRVH